MKSPQISEKGHRKHMRGWLGAKYHKRSFHRKSRSNARRSIREDEEITLPVRRGYCS